LEDIRQAVEGLRREIEEKAKVDSFDSMKLSKKRYSLESGQEMQRKPNCGRRAVASTMGKLTAIGDEDHS
jgi:hypothetical protein